MEYRCKTVNISQLNVSPVGFVMPLCESCKSQDCANPIEKTKISILGVTKDIKACNRGLEIRFVIQCEGYIK